MVVDHNPQVDSRPQLQIANNLGHLPEGHRYIDGKKKAASCLLKMQKRKLASGCEQLTFTDSISTTSKTLAEHHLIVEQCFSNREKKLPYSFTTFQIFKPDVLQKNVT